MKILDAELVWQLQIGVELLRIDCLLLHGFPRRLAREYPGTAVFARNVTVCGALEMLKQTLRTGCAGSTRAITPDPCYEAALSR